VEFDHALVRAAENAGATLVERFEIAQVDATDNSVTLQARDGRRLTAPFVVAADGVHSVIAKRLGVNRKWPAESLAIDMMEETPVATLRAERPDVLWVAYAYNGLDGYAYVFPKTHHVNVGIGCLLSHFKGEVPERPYTLQNGFVRSLVDSGVLHGQSDRRHFTPFLIPVGGPLARADAGRVLFTGDAGGFVNAFTAEGIYYAMVSGELAAEALAASRGLAREAAGRAYDRMWRAELGAELADAVRVQRYLFGKHERVARAVRLAATKSAMVDLIMRFVQGRLSYGALRRRLLLRFPLAVWHMARAS
jgi:flavin-dependent dehydrogenase